MKTKLDEAREVINEIDEQMVDLFIKRMAAVSMVAEYKAENSMPIFDNGREDVIKHKNMEMLANKKLESYYKTFFDGVLKASKDYQNDIINKYKENNKWKIMH